MSEVVKNPLVDFAQGVEAAFDDGPNQRARAEADRRKKQEEEDRYNAQMNKIRQAKREAPGRPILTDRRQVEEANRTMLSGGLMEAPDITPMIGIS